MRSKIIFIIGLILSFILINIFSVNSFYNNFIGKSLYDKKSYTNSVKYFNKSGNVQGVYNFANSLYKQKKYKKAIKEYKSIIGTNDKNIFFSINHNIGNIFYRFGELEKKQNLKIKNWEESVKYYLYALNIKYNEETKKNLEFVLNKIKQEKKKKTEEKQKNNKKTDKKEAKKQGKKQDKKGNSKVENNKKKNENQGKQSKNGEKKGKSLQTGKKQLSPGQQQALKKYQEALKKEQEKNQNNFNKVYKENKFNDPFSNFFNDPFFNNDLLKKGSGKKDW